jgi:desulfoferrodoxin (superoxide reductase-like protein)
MKRTISISRVILGALLVFSLSVFAFPQSAFATAPKDVKLAYNANSQTLTITITHKSLSTGSHYIKKVEIKKNGTLVSDNTYKNQPDPETFTYTYQLSAQEGDTLEVTATCNLWGHKTETLKIK